MIRVLVIVSDVEAHRKVAIYDLGGGEGDSASFVCGNERFDSTAAGRCSNPLFAVGIHEVGVKARSRPAGIASVEGDKSWG